MVRLDKPGIFWPRMPTCALVNLLGEPLKDYGRQLYSGPRGGFDRLAVNSDYCAGMVIKGRASLGPLSESVKKNITTVKARLACRSPLSTQNQ
jgi:hypothetical protein